MNPYGKTAQTAVAAISLLAEVYLQEPRPRLNAAQIAQLRELNKPIVAKVLTQMSLAGLVAGTPGPNGGYALAKPPHEISLLDVVGLFDRQEDTVSCPYGPGYCGTGPHCPLHHETIKIREMVQGHLAKCTLERFAKRQSPNVQSLRRKAD